MMRAKAKAEADAAASAAGGCLGLPCKRWKRKRSLLNTAHLSFFFPEIEDLASTSFDYWGGGEGKGEDYHDSI